MKPDRHRRFSDLADEVAARLPDREGLVFGAIALYVSRSCGAHRRGGSAPDRRRDRARRARRLVAQQQRRVDLHLLCRPEDRRGARADQHAVPVARPRLRPGAVRQQFPDHARSFRARRLCRHGPRGGLIAGFRRYRAGSSLSPAPARDPARPVTAGGNRRLGRRSPNRPGTSPPIVWPPAPALSTRPRRPSSCTRRVRPDFPRAWCGRTS